MYKCTECGMEYEIKPDYCDCGNDEFTLSPLREEKPEAERKAEREEFVNEVKKTEFTNSGEDNKSKQKIYEPRLNIDPISFVIFIICIILSFVIAFLPVKTDDNADNIQSPETKTTKNIPSIDKFWNNSVPVAEKPVTPEPAVAKVVIPVKQKATAPTRSATNLPRGEGNKTVAKKTTVTPKTTTKQTTVKKTTAAPKTTTNAAAEQAKKAEEAKKLEAQRKAEENAKKLAEVKKHAEDLQQSMLDKQELANYKINLRNTIGRKIDFTKVLGDGDCAITFKINSSGRLINGAFAKQSTNMTLNDAVYKAFMSSRNQAAPPKLYNNETLKLTVKFYNGNFEITLN